MKNRCVNRVIEACKELAYWTADYLGGVDKQTLADGYLAGRGGRSYTNDDLVAASKEMGMNCYVPFHFYHCDLGPGNIIVDVKEDDRDDCSISIGIIDWEIAGFVPWE
ncbi:protein kinase-like protein [Apiospora arundinis]